jgi:uroporphyrinogen decarboxylase
LSSRFSFHVSRVIYDMNGKERVLAALNWESVDRLPCMPILHSGLPPIFDVPLGDFFTDAATMASVMVRGYRTFGYDGVQLSLGVTGEAEALGARVEQPPDGAPILREYLIPDVTDTTVLASLEDRDPARGGRMPLFFDAVRQIAAEIGEEAFVLAMLRGPLLAASQLCGVETLLISMITQPEAVAAVLDVTNKVALQLGSWLLESGAHGLILGEATCSPNFISPKLYRTLVQPRHAHLVRQLKAAGWPIVGLHICGDIAPIFEAIVETGVTFLDVDYQVPAAQALDLAQGRVALRGNLDPSSVFRFGAEETVREATLALRRKLAEAQGETPARGWILSSGCDIPPGTPASNLRAFVEAQSSKISDGTG